MWNGKMKALTFSYDDGVTQDRHLVEIFNRYGLHGTFNLNSGLLKEGEGWFDVEWQRRITHVDSSEVKALYRGHEIAVHSKTHANLGTVDDIHLHEEIFDDKAALEALLGYEIVGMAYPYGTVDDRVVAMVRDAGIKYARRTDPSHNFEFPAEPLLWHHTCHHAVDNLFDHAKAFLDLEPDKPQIFSIWGHSYEFDVRGDWDRFERFCEMMAGRDDIAYVTNREALHV
ncbi:MAG: polysaccharide deacetylase family protein [Clostridia bacterium]|nr:polysaccharide deacetylase family protein [Clostridia bacterium]